MNKIKAFLEMIKFEHSVFALPFAYMGYLIGSNGNWKALDLFWITLIMVAARTAGMCLNRIVDRKYDAQNPRTKKRALVTGEISLASAKITTIICLLIFVLTVLQLPSICLKFLPLVLFLLVIYHYLKRFTYLCHFGIGAVLACAPMGGWLVATGFWEAGITTLSLAVLFWVAGFDIFYSLQDMEADQKTGLYSIPSKFGAKMAQNIAVLCHGLTLGFLGLLGIMEALGWLYWVGVLLAAWILAMEHRLIRLDYKKNLNASFFTLNGVLGILVLITTFLDGLLRA